MDDIDEEKQAELDMLQFDKRIYEEITDVFTKHGLQYRDAQVAYDKLTRLRSSMEWFGWRAGDTCTRHFVEALVEIIQDMAEAMNAKNKKDDSNE